MPLDRSRSSAKTIIDHGIGVAVASVDDEPLAVGTVVAGKYEVVRRLAEGGLGIVVLALHRDLNQRVAIKYLKPEALATPALVARFHREARLAASLHSAHVVRVFDVGRHRRAGPYIVMEYLEGSDLASVMGRGSIEVATAVDYILQACDALAEAHAQGIVHRDLKPENLFLARHGTRGTIVKVVDFGLSKVTVPRGQSGAFPRLTEQGERFGTPMFMSPEQLACSADVDARSDIWALGVVLFELLTTELPFEGETAATLAANIFSATPRDLRALRPEVSPALEAVIRRCLAKDPAGRYRDVEELAAELVPHGPAAAVERLEVIRRALRLGSVKPPRKEATNRPPAPRASWRKIALFGGLAMVALAGALWRAELARSANHEPFTVTAARVKTMPPPLPAAAPSPSPAPSSAPAPDAVATAPSSAPAPDAVATAPSSTTTTKDTTAPPPSLPSNYGKPAPAPPIASVGSRAAPRARPSPEPVEEWDIRFKR